MRVVIADDSMLLREGLARLLFDAGITVDGTADSAGDLLSLVDRRPPDVAIVDIRMPPTHTDEGIVAAQMIHRDHPHVGVLVLSQYLESEFAARLLAEVPQRAGYLLKDRVSDIAVVRDALQRIAAGECVIDPTIVTRLVHRARPRGPLDELSERNGQTLFEICARLITKHGLEMSRQAVSQHLEVLESVGLVRTRREGRYKFHDLDTRPLRAIVERWPEITE